MKAVPIISAIIITKNEEKNIGRCLESLFGVADEVIVVDSFSNDTTKQICSAYKVQFLSYKWQGYADTKNYANSLANGEFILSLDADEHLSDALKKAILQFKESQQKADLYSFNRLTNFCGKWIYHCGWYPDRKIRLWRKGLAYWEGMVHERLVINGDPEVHRLKGDLLHHSYYSINEYIHQMIRYTDLAAEEKYSKGKKISVFRLLVSPLSKFLTTYFFRGGFLDGFYGLVICVLSATGTFLKYSKARQLYILGKTRDNHQ